MKKILIFITVIAIIFTFTFCGKNSDEDIYGVTPYELTKDEMLETATMFDCEEFIETFKQNELRANEEYCQKPFIFYGMIDSVNYSSVTLDMVKSYIDCSAEVYLPSEELITLNADGPNIQVVGIFDGYYCDDDGDITISVNNAYFMTDVFKITGTVGMSKSVDARHPDYYCGYIKEASGKKYYFSGEGYDWEIEDMFESMGIDCYSDDIITIETHIVGTHYIRLEDIKSISNLDNDYSQSTTYTKAISDSDNIYSSSSTDTKYVQLIKLIFKSIRQKIIGKVQGK